MYTLKEIENFHINMKKYLSAAKIRHYVICQQVSMSTRQFQYKMNNRKFTTFELKRLLNYYYKQLENQKILPQK